MNGEFDYGGHKVVWRQAEVNEQRQLKEKIAKATKEDVSRLNGLIIFIAKTTIFDKPIEIIVPVSSYLVKENKKMDVETFIEYSAKEHIDSQVARWKAFYDKV